MESPKLSSDDVVKLARLARITLSEEEIELFRGQLTDVIDYNMGLLAEIDVEGVIATAHPTGLLNNWQDDIVRDSLSVGDALSQAPRRTDDMFAVPAVLPST
jgi:aspartyl-tRNA(Asn)/glutamyl-tRNA(Gln) amidotransferase subunit C